MSATKSGVRLALGVAVVALLTALVMASWPEPTLAQDDGVDVGDGAAGGGQAGGWDPALGWHKLVESSSPTEENLNRVQMVSEGEAWAVGDRVILHYTDPNQATPLPATATATTAPSRTPSRTPTRATPTATRTPAKTPRAYLPRVSRGDVLKTAVPTATPTRTATPTITPTPTPTPRPCPPDIKTGQWEGRDGAGNSLRFKVSGDRRSVTELRVQTQTQCGGGTMNVARVPIVNCAIDARATSSGITLLGVGVFNSAREMSAIVGAARPGCGFFWFLSVEPR